MVVVVLARFVFNAVAVVVVGVDKLRKASCSRLLAVCL